ncbi:TPA: hypothetical protein KKL41_002661 [Escherichia coli]|nr:hypothetical protein [Escherichia coli]
MKKLGRPCRFTQEQMADIAYAYYTADRGKEAKEQILSEHGISIAQFYKNMKKLDIKFYVQIGDGQIVEATGF